MRWAPLLMALLLAGCSGAGTTDSTNSAAGTAPVAMNPTGPPVIAGLNWTLGHSWTHDFKFGNGTGGTAFSSTAVVAGVDANGWLLASPNLNDAVSDVGFFLQDLGRMARSGTLTSGAFSFPWYSFPLSDNKTWTATEKNVDPNTILPVEDTLTLVAHWGRDDHKYHVEARSGSVLRARYDFDPAVGWFTSYEGYRGGSTTHVTLKESKAGYAGKLYTAAGINLYGVIKFAGGAPATPPVGVEPGSFTMTSAMTHLMFLQFAFGAPGAGATQILAPDGTRFATFGAFDQNGATVAGDSAQTQQVVPAQAGPWQIDGSGAGVFAQGYGLFAWGATVTELQV